MINENEEFNKRLADLEAKIDKILEQMQDVQAEIKKLSGNQEQEKKTSVGFDRDPLKDIYDTR
ncbi:hypothetical protein N8755_05700 [Alphaproteobacteria bacterium]|nr:hypothetical protein [Alphaproteobacteria bacterium]